MSSSSSSCFCFFGALRGFALPPIQNCHVSRRKDYLRESFLQGKDKKNYLLYYFLPWLRRLRAGGTKELFEGFTRKTIVLARVVYLSEWVQICLSSFFWMSESNVKPERGGAPQYLGSQESAPVPKPFRTGFLSHLEFIFS